ncbi:type III secretion system export apparatus subunit SctR [Simkania negevensis]|uniref:Type III secretion system export apparatus subunit SctR n=1 Tax=Simkania negevensis TaxID=83561 RepID=A0ABS3APH8_9BACT|nr:type III secretion system export apparatus subunit SctR [Simkania negevensis]
MAIAARQPKALSKVRCWNLLSFPYKGILFALVITCFFLLLPQQLLSQTLPGPANDPLAHDVTPPLAAQASILAFLALLPFLFMMLTSYVKTVIVLSLLRNALGVQQAPPNQVVNGIAIILAIYIMFPTGLAMFQEGEEALKSDIPEQLISQKTAVYLVRVIDASKQPLQRFLEKNSSQKHITGFHKLAVSVFPEPYKTELTSSDFIIIIPAFITTQIKDAFEIGVLIYLPFFVVDLVVSNILLAMGMMMLSPMTIALPLKLLLVVMLDGWTVLIQGLVLTFQR